MPLTVAPVAAHVQTLMRGLLDAVAHMHAHGISHRDLKLENLVFGRAGDLSTVTIVDFGLAKAARARERMEGVTGTLWYSAPEILKGVPYSPVVDVWSLGVVMYLILTGASLSASSFSCRRLFYCKRVITLPRRHWDCHTPPRIAS
jgi:serine/threonine protein kinase